MTISYNQIPSTLRVPFMAVEINNQNAVQGAVIQPYRILMIGQRLPAGTVQAEIPTPITSKEQAQTYFGRGSMLAQMAEFHFKANKLTETWAVALDDDAAGVAATGSIAFTGPATAGGTLFLYVGGRRLTVGVNTAQAATAIATAVAAAINANADLAVTAVAASSAVNLTAKHKGTAANGLDVRFNYNTGEAFPAGVAATVTALSGGTSNPALADAIAALGDVQYNVISNPYTDAVSLSSLEQELADRWGPMRMLGGVSYTSAVAGFADLGTLGNSRNSPFSSIMGMPGGLSAPWEVAASYAASAAYYLNIDPARQLRTIPLPGILAPQASDRLTLEERNLLLYDGISTFTVDADGTVRIERAITTYKTTPTGADDESYLDVMTVHTVDYLRYDWRNYILTKYPRHKLANDGTRYGQGQAIITPSVGKAEAIARFRKWEDMGLVENADQFKRDLIVERDATDPNRMNWLLSPDIINNFMIGATQIAFLLQGDTTAE
ncbi:phage tail sheath subtilisin-like domain-containing protein [Bradyrhizobium sp.]|uniref:phage tail sheath subtilisin-like domain-containing protein n=1 Tax=Bradyrhizobium sp. TaxID=376 RepID=UPI0039E6D46C